jgi:ubiquinol-cytochrome c reductase cytochrome b subunit
VASSWREWAVDRFVRCRDWAADRFGWNPIQKHVLDRRVAKGSWYFGDGATLLLLFGVQVVTGAFMMLTYAPTPDGAYQSVRYITEQQMFGWFVRGLHYWSAGMMVFMLFFHLFRQILVGGYKPPREATWLIGVVMFFAVIAMSFTGYVLRWDERGIYALRVALHMFHNVPLIGDGLVVFVQGGEETGAQSLTRIYAVHVIFIPLLLLFLAGWHLYLVMLHGITSPSERRRPVHSAEEQRELYEEDKVSEERGETFFPTTAAKSGAMALVVFLTVLTLTLVLGPRDLDPEANLVERAFPVEEWWFWWYSALIAITPSAFAPALVVLFPIVLFLVLVSLPFIDRGPNRGIRRRPIAALVVVICVVTMFYLSGLRLESPWTGWPDPEPPPVPPGIELTREAEEGRQLFATYGCNTCHPVAGQGWQFGPDLARIPEVRTRAEMREYILAPPEGVAMPAYAGRISEEELGHLLDFVHAAQTFPRE